MNSSKLIKKQKVTQKTRTRREKTFVIPSRSYVREIFVLICFVHLQSHSIFLLFHFYYFVLALDKSFVLSHMYVGFISTLFLQLNFKSRAWGHGQILLMKKRITLLPVFNKTVVNMLDICKTKIHQIKPTSEVENLQKNSRPALLATR